MSSSAPGGILGRVFGLHWSGSEGSKDTDADEEAMAVSGGELELELSRQAGAPRRLW
jgi:hypothetical protein